MPKKKRELPPRNITRFNYWIYFRPDGIPTKLPLRNHIKSEFLHLQNRSLFDALKSYVEDDKEWRSDASAWEVFRRLSLARQAQIFQIEATRWQYKSQWNWDTLLRTIANDQALFARYCDRSLTEPELNAATHRRVFQHYSHQAIYLLGGGGTYIRPSRRSRYDIGNLLEESESSETISCLNIHGRIASRSVIDGADWLKCTSNAERREAKKLTLHWFHHSLRNLREYRYRLPPVPWNDQCERACRQIMEKIRSR